MKTVLACSAALVAAFTAVPAMAQSNPFMPPQAGMSREQIQQIVQAEIAKARASQPSTPTRDPSGKPITPPTGGDVQSRMNTLPTQQGGTPTANVAAVAAEDPVAELLKAGGSFVGCVSGTPVFKDKIGRRAYFTTKELRESNEARRFTRCG